MQVDEADDDNAVRESYNFAPGYYGAVYRADTPDQGGWNPDQEVADAGETSQGGTSRNTQEGAESRIKYKLQAMKWGLIPFWTKRSPDYGSVLKTINCRDDSLIEDRGMWTSMKRRKRCIVICQGFYEWLKKGPSGKEKIPYFIRRKDGGLLCFAGLWDCVKYEGMRHPDCTEWLLFGTLVKQP
jgi:putative SOS response-associated peptidase YedK